MSPARTGRIRGISDGVKHIYVLILGLALMQYHRRWGDLDEHGRGPMPKLLRSSESRGCGATIQLDRGEVVFVSIAQVGVLVRNVDRSGGFFKTLMSNFLGAKLYMKAASIGMRRQPRR
jgi:hypothetical protein